VSKVLYYHCLSFPELVNKLEYKLANSFGILSPCFRLGFTNHFDINFDPVPDIPANFTPTFRELVNRRATELWDIGKPIRLWWSGGIDSTCALVGLLQTRRLDCNIIVYLSNKSVEENPDFYDILVKNKVKLQWHSLEDYMYDNTYNWNGETINVNGCGGDELFLSITDRTLDIESFFKIKDTHWSNIVGKFDYNTVEKYIELSPYKPETCWELLWWFSRTTDDLSSRYMSPRFLKDPSVYSLEHAFFYTKYFELWSISNPYAGHNGTPDSYKYPMKKYIYDFDKNENYLNHKKKISSLPYVWANRRSVVYNKIVYEDGTYVRN
tara:strand:- start:231 stop:1202 length:972 start_codon:yes stop_codon:yes gene_type:complete